VRRALTEENSLFRILSRSNPPVQWETLSLDRIIPLAPPSSPGAKDGFFCKAVPLHGSFPDYVSDSLKRNFPPEEAVIGLQLVQKDKRFFYASIVPGLGASSQHSVYQRDQAVLDVTL